MKSIPLVLVIVVALAALIGGTFVLTAPDRVPVEDLRATSALRGSAPLDGRVFVAEMGPEGKPANVKDTLVFDDGLFLSAECERRCDYPARPYFARLKDGATEFIAETRCPNKDAKMVWRGTIRDNTIKGEFTWTSSRWYWTFERNFWFEGRLSEKTASIESS